MHWHCKWKWRFDHDFAIVSGILFKFYEIRPFIHNRDALCVAEGNEQTPTQN
jgi:hypothetical protein